MLTLPESVYPLKRTVMQSPRAPSKLPFSNPVSARASVTWLLNTEPINVVPLYGAAFVCSKQRFLTK